MLSQITSKQLTVKKAHDDEIDVLRISSIDKNQAGNIIKMYMNNKENDLVILLIKLDENQAFETAFVVYDNHYGVYIQE